MSARTKAWLALLVVWIVWGSTYLAIRVGVRTLPPFAMAGVRYTVAGLILLPIGLATGSAQLRASDRPGRKQWATMLLLGAMLPAGGNGVVSWAEVRLPSGLAALLIGTVPLWIVLADSLLSRRAPARRQWVALLVGMVGIGVLSAGGTSGAAPIGPIFVALLAALSWGIGSALAPRLPVPKRPLLLSGMELFCGGIVLLIVALVTREHVHWHAISAESVWALVYLIGPGSLLAMTCYLYVLTVLPATTAATYAYVNPVVAVFLGVWLIGESLSATELIGGAIVVLAVVGLVSRGRSVDERPETDELPAPDMPEPAAAV
ncbi:MAG: EamA family transporter [Actinobacteria bacterium]|nr:EamA family transporter [Actinomycetota bacterium]